MVHLHDKDWVFVPAGDKQIPQGRPATGTTGSGDGFVQVISGLQPEQKVVSNALQLSSAAEEQ